MTALAKRLSAVAGALIFIGAAPPPARLTIARWTGANLPTATAAAAKYRLHVAGTPNARIALHAEGVATGWLAAFCTPTFCSPMRVDATLSPAGLAEYQFELIREDPSAPPHSGARIAGSDGSSVLVPP